ncbi:hypothetical protein T12_10067 [Trichinella patagoniensis]|uniref:Uncharacterized protein n=1 Tax=Trichinella patagoniensis TaxID=990121 RepID=A0A0V0Z7N1_9BILA|nr:hypothetical protein T12_10067 [Trichinella patagoniensis]
MEIEKEIPGGCLFLQLLARPDVQQRIKNTNTQINTVQVYHILKAARTLRITRAQFKETFLIFDKKKVWLVDVPGKNDQPEKFQMLFHVPKVDGYADSREGIKLTLIVEEL